MDIDLLSYDQLCNAEDVMDRIYHDLVDQGHYSDQISNDAYDLWQEFKWARVQQAVDKWG